MSEAVLTNTVLPTKVSQTLMDGGTDDRLQPTQQSGSELLLFADIFQQFTPLQPITPDNAPGTIQQTLTASILTATPLIEPVAKQSLLKNLGITGNLLPPTITGGILTPPPLTIPPTTGQETTTPLKLQTPTDNSLTTLNTLKPHQALEAATTAELPATQVAAESLALPDTQTETVKPATISDRRLAFLSSQNLLNQITTSAAMVSTQEKADATTQQRAVQTLVPEINRLFSGIQINTGNRKSGVDINITSYMRNLQMAQSMLGYSNGLPSNEENNILPNSAGSVDLQAVTLAGFSDQSAFLQNHAAATPQHLHTAALTTTSTTADTSSRPVFEVALNQPDWEQRLGERLMWMGNKQIQSASICLNPPGLGPVDIDLNIKKDQININFLAQGVHAKEALDFAIPKLREMFLESGFNSVNVNVSSQQHGQYQQRRYPDDYIQYSARTSMFQQSSVEPTKISSVTSPAAGGRIQNHIDLYT